MISVHLNPKHWHLLGLSAGFLATSSSFPSSRWLLSSILITRSVATQSIMVCWQAFCAKLEEMSLVMVSGRRMHDQRDDMPVDLAGFHHLISAEHQFSLSGVSVKHPQPRASSACRAPG